MTIAVVRHVGSCSSRLIVLHQEVLLVERIGVAGVAVLVLAPP